MAEEECFGWLDTVAQPAHKVVIVDASLESLGVELDQDFQKCEVEILLLCRA